jgi:hypothetical protein
MSIKNLFVAILLVGTLHSCQNSQTTNEQKQQNTEKALGLDGKGTNIMREALVIHDEAMQHMSEISQFRSLISTEAAKPKADSKKLKELEAQLAAADQAMLDWMHAFKKPVQSRRLYRIPKHEENRNRKGTKIDKRCCCRC